MCGVIAWIGQPGSTPDRAVIERASARMHHRGPDGHGLSQSGHVALGHQRLAIIDLAGAVQPMEHPSGLRLTFNGEIYNFRSLRRRLQGLGHSFRLDSDTEVLAAACAQWGPDAVNELEGMYAFVVDDPNRDLVWAARDPLGQKPLYACDERFFPDAKWLFVSELKAVIPEAKLSLNRLAAIRFLAYDFVPDDDGIYAGVQKLLPGELWCIQRSSPGAPKRRRFFSLHPDEVIHHQPSYLESLEQHLDRAVQRRLVSDVPLGVFLSGGIDSSLITALAVRHREPSTLKTFAIGFEEESFDESDHAQIVADHLGTDHHCKIINAQDLLDVVPRLLDHQDEPFGDPSIIPTYLLSQFARKQVTVALGGDGGDELFLGYPTFVAERLRRSFRWLPRLGWETAAAASNILPVGQGNYPLDYKIKRFFAGSSRPLPDRHQVWIGGALPKTLKRLAPEISEATLYAPSRKTWAASLGEDEHRLTQLYAQHYLGAGVLQKADRASMKVSLELRAPFLDRNVVRHALKAPTSLRLHGLQTKVALRRVAQRLLPESIVNRPKKGFGIPLAQWLRGPLKDWLEGQLNEEGLMAQNLFPSTTIQELIKEHVQRRQDHGKLLWNLACLSIFLRRSHTP